jgi:hypothetical protein
METLTRRTYNPGNVKIGSRDVPVFIRAEFKDGKLSLTGVEGPMSGGNCKGSCGQIEMSLSPDDFTSFEEGWDSVKIARLLEIWRGWHLNDMRAGCEHQRARKWGSKKVLVTTYRLTNEASSEQRRIKTDALNKLKKGDSVQLPQIQIDTLVLPWETKRIEKYQII